MWNNSVDNQVQYITGSTRALDKYEIYIVYRYLAFDRYIGSNISVSVNISIINKDNSLYHFFINKLPILHSLMHARGLTTCTTFTLIDRKTNNQAGGLDYLDDIITQPSKCSKHGFDSTNSASMNAINAY